MAGLERSERRDADDLPVISRALAGSRRVLGFVVILLLWEAGVRAGFVNRSIMPAPSVAITPSDLATLKATASFAHEQKLTKTLADHDRAVNHDLLKRAEAEMAGKPFDPRTVKVVKP